MKTVNPPLAAVRTAAKSKHKEEMTAHVQNIVETMSLPYVIVEIALSIYAEAVEKKIAMCGATKKTMAAAMVFIACRQRHLSRSFKELEEATGLTKKSIGRAFTLLTKTLALELTCAKATEFVNRFCAKLRLSSNVWTAVYRVVEKAERLELTVGMLPAAVVAAVIFLLAYRDDDEAERSLGAICEASHVGEKNIRTTSAKLFKSRAVLFGGLDLS